MISDVKVRNIPSLVIRLRGNIAIVDGIQATIQAVLALVLEDERKRCKQKD